MKYIVKQAEPPAFSEWKNLANEDWQPTYGTLSGDPKKAVKNALMAEQGFICCYCERRLTKEDSHIEHFCPKSRPDVDPLDFGNMLCSCQNEHKSGEPRFCGIAKRDWFDPKLLISPLDPDCEKQFSFTGAGMIRPSDEGNLAATETIKKLNLDEKNLNAMRAKAIDPFLDNDISNEEMQQFVAGYLRKGENGQYGEFWTTINYLFGNTGSH